MTTYARLLLIAVTSLMTASLGAQYGPLGPEASVNQVTASTQRTDFSGRSVAKDSTGRFVVVWTSALQDTSNDGIFARRYAADGTPLGAEFQVNTHFADDQFNPAVAVADNGNFVVVWESNQQDGNLLGVFGQLYDANGNPIGAEFQVNTTTTDYQDAPAVAMDADGDFVVTWQGGGGQDGDGVGIYCRRYSNTGASLSGEILVNTTTAGGQRSPDIAMDDAGNFVIVFHHSDVTASEIYFQRFDSAGAPVGSQTIANTYTSDPQDEPSVSMDADGDFVVTWQSFGQDAAGTQGVYAQRFDGTGAPVGSEFRVNTTTSNDQQAPNVSMDANGNFVVSWQSFNHDAPTTWGVYAQRYSNAGTALGSQFIVNQTTAGQQQHASVALGNNADTVFVWTGPDASVTGVYVRLFGMPPVTPVLTLNGATASYTEGAVPTVLAPASTATDPDSADFDTGHLLVEITTAPQIGDVLLIATTTNVRRTGTNIEYDATGAFSGAEVVVGTVPATGAGSGLGGNGLQVTFNAACTPAIAQAVLRAAAFVNNDQNPSGALRVVRFTVNDGDGNNSNQPTINVNVTPVADAPTLSSFTLLSDNEDNPKTITFNDLEAAGDEADVDSSPVYFRIANLGSGTLLLNGLPASVGADVLPGATLLWTPPSDAIGTHTVAEFVALDAAVGTLTSATAVPLQVSLAQVNDEPSFQDGGNPPQSILGTGPQTVGAWATLISAGPANESGQLLTFNVTVTGGTLTFSTSPAVDPVTGNLTYTASSSGTASVEIELQDDGGVANGGDDTSAPVVITIDVAAAPGTIYVDPTWAGMTFGQDPPGPATFYGIDGFATVQDAMTAASAGNTIVLAAGTYTGFTVTKALTLQGSAPGTTIRGASPALTVNTPGVVSNGIDYEVDTVPVDDPTILITSGDLTISNGTVTESSAFNQAAIRLTGGTIVFGTGVTLNRQSTGQLIDNQTASTIDATGVTLQNSGGAFASNFAIEDAITHALDNGANGLVTWVAGNLYVTTNSNSIQRAVNAATAGDTINITDGTYVGATTINKSLTIVGPNAGVHGTSGSRGAEARVSSSLAGTVLFTVSAAGVTIDGLEFFAFNNLVSRCVTTSGTTFSGLDIRNCLFRRDATSPATGFGSVHAIEVTGDGTQSVTIHRNRVAGTVNGSPPPAFRAVFAKGVQLTDVIATVGGAVASDGNTIRGFEEDLLVQNGGNTTIQNNTFVGTGVDVVGPAAGVSINIFQNSFSPTDHTVPQSLLVRFNDSTTTVAVTGNVFTNHTVGAVIAGARNVTLDGNTFSNAAGATDYTHVLFSTSWPTASPPPAAVTGASLDLRNNLFNHVAGPAAGRALDFQNGNSVSTVGTILVGPAGNANTFDGNLPQYIRLQTSTLAGPLFSPATNPAPANFTTNMDASNNTFGGLLPTAMSLAQLAALEAKLQHKVDIPALGLISLGINNSPQLINGPYTLTAINEDNFTASGDPVDLSTDIFDVDGPNTGMAVIAVDNTNGTWQFSTNNGGVWTAFGAVSNTSAVLLASDTLNNRIRFVPNANFFGTASITLRGWDQVAGSGTSGQTAVDVSINGTGTGFSSNTETATITVNPVNDAPTFTASNPAAVNEDGGLQTVSSWAGSFNPGPANESGQTVAAYIVSNISNPGLFAVAPAVDTSGNLTYTPAADAFGTSTFDVQVQDNGGVANGGADTSAAQQFTITVNAVNDAPTFTASSPAAVDEDSGLATVNGWAGSFNPGPANESSQTVAAYIVSNISNPGLFAVAPAVDALGNLTYTPAADAFGTSTFDVQVQDNGGVANGGVDTSAAQQFTITVNAVNDAPSFTASNPAAVNEDSGAQTVSSWAGSFNPGPANESGQTVAAYIVSNISNPGLFAIAPAVDTSGNLTYTPAANAFGTSTFDVQVQDNGGVANGGVDTSAVQQFTITVNAVNDAPSFTASSPAAVDEDSGLATVNGWAGSFNPGPANESSQTVAAYIVTNVSNPGLFAVAPAVDALGNLTYTPAADAFGTSTFDVQVQDDGGTLNGGVDTSAAQQFTITVNPINDAPTFTGGANPIPMIVNPGAQSFPGWATGMSVGPANESAQSLVAFTVTQTGGPLGAFTVAPSVTLGGTLSYTPAAASTGTFTFDVTLTDNGPGVAPDVNTSAAHVLTIIIVPVPTQVYVDNVLYAGLNQGDPAPAPATYFGIDAFTVLQPAVNTVANGGTVSVAAGIYVGATISKDLSLGLQATTSLRGASPVISHSTGTLTITGGELDQNTAFPTIALSGGTLILDGVTVLESSVGNHAAIEVTAGTLDLSTFGGNTVRVRGPGGLLIDNNNAAGINAIGLVPNVWQEFAVPFDTSMLADNFAIEDRVTHATDAAGRGFVLWNSGHVYVTTNSASIQRGINAATAGDTLHITAGEFAGAVVVDRALTVEGAQLDQDADIRFAAFTGGKASTAVETVITAGNNNPTGTNPGAEDLVRVLADDVTLNGLVIDGNNPTLGASAVNINSVPIHARRGVTNINSSDVSVNVSSLLVLHCVVQNFGQSAVFWSNSASATNGVVRQSVLRNFAVQGVLTASDAYLDLLDNTVEVADGATGLDWQNFTISRALNAATTWSDNRITVGVNATGIRQHGSSVSASPLNIEDNIVNAVAAATFADPLTRAIHISTVEDNSTTTITNNTVGASGGEFARGINLWNLPTSVSVTVSNGSVANSAIGIALDNVDVSLGDAENTAVAVSNVTIDASCLTGLLVRSALVNAVPADGNVSVNLNNCTVAAVNDAIRVETDSTFTADLIMTGGSATGGTGLRVLGSSAEADVNMAGVTGSGAAVIVDGGTLSLTQSTINAGTFGVNVLNGGSILAFANNFLATYATVGLRIDNLAGSISAIFDNSFTGSGIAVQNLTATQVDARQNWWGSTRGPTEASNPGGNGGAVTSLALVLYTPWWASGVDTSLTAGFQGGDTTGSPSSEDLHAIPTQLFWDQQPVSTQFSGVAFSPMPELRAQDAFGNLGYNFQGAVSIVFVTNPTGAGITNGVEFAVDGDADFPTFTVSLGGVFTFQAFAVGPLGSMQSPISGLVIVNNPTPVLTMIAPDWANEGSGSTLVTLSGSGFNSLSQGRINGSGRATLFVDTSTLMMVLLASDLATPAQHNITVFNGLPGGGTSANLPFTVNGIPSAINLSANTVAENQPANTLIGTLSVTDAFPLLDSHTLALVFGPGSGGNSSFTLVGNQLFTAASFDFETQSSYSIRVRATDSFGAFFETALTINVTNVNEAPLAVADSYNGTEDTVLAVNAAAGVIANDSDVDGTTPQAALTSAPAPAAAVAAFTLNTDGSFSLTPAANFNGTITFQYQADDGSLTSAPVTVTITIASVNDVPVPVADTYGATEDVVLNVNAAAGVLSNDSDLHGGAAGENNTPLTAALVSHTTNGSISLNSDGSFSYTPAANFSGADSFTYRAIDSLGGQSAVATVTINVGSSNDAPVLINFPYAFNSQAEDDTAQIGDDIDLSGDITDSDGPGTGLAVIDADNTNGQWQFTLTGGAPWTNLTGLSDTTATLIASGVNTRIRFIPNANFFGTASIQLRGWDTSTGTSGTSGVDVSTNGGTTAFSANVATATITITPVNDAPTLGTVNTLTGASEDTPFGILFNSLLAAADEADIDSTGLSFRIEAISSGTLTINGGAVTAGSTIFTLGDLLAWTPAADANGTLAAFTVTAWDGALASATPVQVSVTVTPVNDPPSFTKGSDPTVGEDSTAFTQAGWATAISTGPADEAGQSVTFIVTGNTNPGLFSTQPAVSPTGTLTFTPAADANGSATVSLVAQDNGGGNNTSAVQTFVINITPVNDAPTLTAVSTLTGAFEDTQFVIFYAALQAAANEADIDSATVNFRIEAISSGTLTINGGAVTAGTTIFANGDQLEWTPALNANGVLPAFTIRAHDGSLVSAAAVQVSVGVAAINDAPTLTTVGTLAGATEDTQFVIPFATLATAANEADVDSATISFRIESISSGTLTINSGAVFPGTTIFAAGAQLEWTPAANANGVLPAFTVRAWDGALASATPVQVSVNVAAVDDAPELVLPTSGTSFVDLGGGVYRLTMNPGTLPANAVLQVVDIDSATAALTVTPPGTLPAGITAPVSNPTLAAGALVAFTGSSSTTDPLLSPYQYTFTLAGAASPWTVQIVVNDVPPQHSVASGFGLGTAGNPYTSNVGLGGSPAVVLANVFELNTAQTISLVGATLISPTGSPFSASYTGTGSTGAISAQSGRTLNIGDVGNHDMSVTVTDGQTNVTIFVRITVLNVGNVPPTSGLATGSTFTATGANQFQMDVDPNQTLANADLVLSDADGDPLTVTGITAAPVALGGVVPPPILVTALSPLAISFTGTIDPSFAPQDYVYSLVVTDNITAPVTITITFSLQDLAPTHVAGPDADATTPGTGTSTDPYKVSVLTGHNSPLVMSIVTDQNTGQTLSLTGVNTSAQPLMSFTFALTGSGNTGDIVITPNAPLGAADVGVWLVEFFISDGGTNTISVFVEITVTPAPPPPGDDDDDGCSTNGRSGMNLLWLALPALALLWRPRRRKA